MEADTISKNGASLKSHTSKGNMLKILCFIAISTLLFSCHKEDNNGDEPSSASFKYEFFTNPNDPYFLKAVNEDGSEVIFSGDKDENGLLLNITNTKITKGNTDYNIDYSNGKAVKFYDNNNNIIFIDYNDSNYAIASMISQNNDTVYHFQVACKNNNLSKSTIGKELRSANANDGYYYLRYKVKLEYVDIAPNAKFSENYYNHQVTIYDNDVNFKKNAELVERGNDYAIYQLKLNPGYDNEPLQNTVVSNGLRKLSGFLDASTGIDWADLASQASMATPSTARWSGEITFAVQYFQTFMAPLLNGTADDIYTNRKVGDSFKIMVSVTGTGCNKQTQIKEINYTDLKQQQGNNVHLEITLKNIFPFEETFMYATVLGDWHCTTSGLPEENYDLSISLKENGIAIAEGIVTGTWSTTGNSISIKFSGEDKTSFTLNGTVNDDKTQITGNCIDVWAYYEGDKITNETYYGTFIMNKTQGKVNSMELKSLKSTTNFNKRNVFSITK